jgi:phosphoglucosamine mutase
MLAEEVCDTKKSLGALTEGLTVYPQVMKNVKVKDKEAVLNDEEVNKIFSEVEALIGGEGRALLRKSGTEPKIRVMIEAVSEELCEKYADMIVKVILERGYGA